MNAPSATISVIIPHFNDLAGLEICLAALDAQTLSRDRFEIVVGDNGSPQGIAAVEGVVRGRGRVVLVETRGAGPARNGAVAVATGDVLAFIDSDCVAEPAWLEEGLRALDSHDFVGGHVKVLVDDEQRMTPSEAFERVFAFDFKTYIEKKGFTGSGNLFCPATVFREVGGFRTGVSEDTEWSFRARAGGFRLGYAPRAVVGHPARRTWAELLGKWRRTNRESFALSVDGPAGRVKWVLRMLALPASALVHTPRVLGTPKLNTVGQRVNALMVLYALRLWRVWDSAKILWADIRGPARGASRPGATDAQAQDLGGAPLAGDGR